MNENKGSSLKKLIDLSKIDAAIEKVEREKKRLARELEEKKKTVILENQKYSEKSKALKLLKDAIVKEEKGIKEENQKLTDRRKALSSFSNYKLQQSAEKEIEAAAQLISAREDALLKTMESLESLEKETQKYEEVYKSAADAFESLFAGAKDQLVAFESKQLKSSKERSDIIPAITKDFLSVYEKVRQRNPDNPLVSLKNKNSCGGCFMQIGPQLVVHISSGAQLVKCPGCTRILYIEESKEE